MSIFEQLENLNDNAEGQRNQLWKGTFREFLRLYETKEYPNIGVLSHRRICQMIESAGVETKDYFGRERKSYKFFEDHLFGMEDTIDALMDFIHSAAQRTETARRMLLLFGPPSSGKSALVELLKRGLEKYTHTKEGAMFALSGSKMHENPFLLVPAELRPEFEKHYGLPIEGELSPLSRYRLVHEFQGKFMDYPVEQVWIDEANRVGIGTWLPSDPKSTDQSELVGSIDFARIQEFGDEADPRAYNFNGELNVANRGIMEFIEGLRAEEKFLRILLTATQEKNIKAPRFGLIFVDTFIILHTNESEFISFMNEKKYEAYHDRMNIVAAPYNLGTKNEVHIYQKLLANSDAVKDIHIAPKTLDAAAMLATMARLEITDDLSLVKKMKLYDGEHVKGYKTEQVPDIRKKSQREGMYGISPRFVIDQISAAISRAKDEDRNFITALDVLRQLNRGIRTSNRFTQEEKNRYEEFIDIARNEWNEMLRNDIQKAFFLSFDDEARSLCENYLDMIEASCGKQKPRDPITGEPLTEEQIKINEKLMNSIEEQIEISSSGKHDFRTEILRAAGAAARKNRKFDYTQHAQLKEAIQKQLFEERRGTIRMTVATRNPDPEALRRINDVVNRMVEHQGYTAESANELLKYATAHLFDK